MHFQAFVLDEWGNALEMSDLECETLSEAMQRAQRMVKDLPVELWNGPRRAGRFTPKMAPFEQR